MHIINVNNLNVEYPIYGFSVRSLKHELLRLSTGGTIKNQDATTITIKALDNINFQLSEGDRVGLIGHNGSGKSTLLRVLADIYPPTQGTISIDGKTSTLFDLSLGLDEEMTGYDNIILRGIIHGLAKKEIIALSDIIIEKSELGKYIDMPIRTYSSGMRMRLAFSIVTSLPAEILLIDEVVGTGDASFMEKATLYFNEMINRAKIAVIASHNTAILKEFCNKLMILEQGRLIYFGDDLDNMLQTYLKK